MRGIVPAQQGPIGKELVRVEDLLLGLDEPELQLIGRPEEPTADFIQRTIRHLVRNEDDARKQQ